MKDFGDSEITSTSVGHESDSSQKSDTNIQKFWCFRNPTGKVVLLFTLTITATVDGFSIIFHDDDVHLFQ